MTLSPTLRAELAKCRDTEIMDILCAIIEPSTDTPFDRQSGEFSEDVSEWLGDAFNKGADDMFSAWHSAYADDRADTAAYNGRDR